MLAMQLQATCQAVYIDYRDYIVYRLLQTTETLGSIPETAITKQIKGKKVRKEDEKNRE